MDTSDKLTLIVSYILKYAVFLSITLIIIGISLMFINGNANGVPISKLADFNNAQTGTYNSSSFSPTQIPGAIMSLDALGFISLGLWVLIFTPVTVLVSSLVEYIYVKNKLYTILTFVVLFNLMAAILIVPHFVKV
ncbi:MAG: DUF1634 domain-containing protein [Candidatus Thermoplasmatota archaeon]|jgi:uncharacterized membrane protein|nr:DUF1634 domain-containing protein [Candidatus Thermoplasmatota archaeon]MCL5988174.1 DUF1634 domain-containing protein [Candidatus Thermoplasmatota archaeon]